MKYVGPGSDAYHVGREKLGAFRRPYQACRLEWMGSMPDVLCLCLHGFTVSGTVSTFKIAVVGR